MDKPEERSPKNKELFRIQFEGLSMGDVLWKDGIKFVVDGVVGTRVLLWNLNTDEKENWVRMHFNASLFYEYLPERKVVFTDRDLVNESVRLDYLNEKKNGE